MNTPFRLDQHPRRAQPLAAPPVGYFDQLPTRVMAGLPRAAAPAGPAWWGQSWWLALTGEVQMTLAASGLLLVFAASFWLLSGPAGPTGTASLNAVPRQEMVNYLLTDGTAAVEPADLAALVATHPALTHTFLRPTPAEVEAMLDAQPSDETQYF